MDSLFVPQAAEWTTLPLSFATDTGLVNAQRLSIGRPPFLLSCGSLTQSR